MSTVATCKLLVTDNNKLSLIVSLPLNVNVIKFVKKYAVKLFGFTITYGFLHPVTAKLQQNLIGLESGSGSGRMLLFEIRPNPVPAGFGKTESGAALLRTKIFISEISPTGSRTRIAGVVDRCAATTSTRLTLF